MAQRFVVFGYSGCASWAVKAVGQGLKLKRLSTGCAMIATNGSHVSKTPSGPCTFDSETKPKSCKNII